MDAFAREAAEFRAEAFQEAAARMGVQPTIVEKDFWVCWILKRIFALPDPMVGLIFKGGTSLSKAYGVIARFSEDIDLSLDRHDLGFTGPRDPANPELGSNARKKLLEELQDDAVTLIGDTLKRKIEIACSEALGDNEFVLTVDPYDPQTLLFAFPESLGSGAYGAHYIKPAIRLEFGARSEHVPAESKTLEPYVAEQIDGLLSEPRITVKALAAERTFWEKATILHALAHRDPSKPFGNRQSRHYADLTSLAESNIKSSALADLPLLEAVAQHKAIFFAAAWAHYDTARPGSLKLAPPSVLEPALRKDYESMREMFFNEPLSFDEMMTRVRALEIEINAGEAV